MQFNSSFQINAFAYKSQLYKIYTSPMKLLKKKKEEEEKQLYM